MNQWRAYVEPQQTHAAAVRSLRSLIRALRQELDAGAINVDTALCAALVDLEADVRYTLVLANRRFNDAHPRRGRAVGRPR